MFLSFYAFWTEISNGVHNLRFTLKMTKPPLKKRKQERLTEPEKQLIIKSYAMEVPLSTLSRQIGKSRNAISTFYCRWKLDSTLPPRSLIKIQGSMGLAIKKQVLDTPKLGIRKLTQKLKERLPGRDWYYMLNIRYPCKSTIHNFLQVNAFKKRNPTLKAPLSEINKKKRLDFANRWLDRVPIYIYLFSHLYKFI